MEPALERILAKLAQVRQRAPGTVGAPHHGFALSAPLAEAHVRAFELKHGVALPTGFRAFVTRCGASGAGPYTGLLPMEQWSTALYGHDDVPSWPARPFLFAPDTPREDAAYARIVAGIAKPFQGAIAIVHQGCVDYGALVVSGVHAGRVVYLDLDGGTPIFVENEDFLSWYERWLDELLWGHQSSGFGMGMPGSEAQLRAAAADSSSPRRADALSAMSRLPRVGAETAAVIGACLGDAETPVRKRALELVAKFKIPGFDGAVQAALDDAQGAVRRAALLAKKARGEDWQPHAQRARQVVTRALQGHAESEVVRGEEVVPLLDSADESVVAAALQVLEANPSSGAVDALLARTRDAGPDSLPALLAHVRAGVMDAAQVDAAFERVLRRWREEPTTLTTCGLGAFLERHPRALAALLAAMRHPDAFTRFDAAMVLGNLFEPASAAMPAVRDALQALASDRTVPQRGSTRTAWSVGESARRALAKILARMK